MPRSVPHEFDGPLGDVKLRVWERRKEATFHTILEGRYVHRCERSVEHPLEIQSRWDMPATAEPWHGLARRARDRDPDAARKLATAMVDEALAGEWQDPCTAEVSPAGRQDG